MTSSWRWQSYSDSNISSAFCAVVAFVGGGEVAVLVQVGITQYSAIVFSMSLRASSCQSFACKLPASCSFSCSSGPPHAILMYDSLKYGCKTLIGSINRRWKTTQITYQAREYKQACSRTCCNTSLSFGDRNWWHSYKEQISASHVSPPKQSESPRKQGWPATKSVGCHKRSSAGGCLHQR